MASIELQCCIAYNYNTINYCEMWKLLEAFVCITQIHFTGLEQITVKQVF